MKATAWRGRFSGAVYGTNGPTSAVGLAQHRFNRGSARAEALRLALEVIEENRGYWPLTVRTVLYRMMDRYQFPKSKAGSLYDAIDLGRRAGVIHWSAIAEDRTQVQKARAGYDGPRDFFDAVVRVSRDYKRDRTDGQPFVVEVWMESAGMALMVARMISRFDIPVYSASGFNSTTSKYDLAIRAKRRDVPTVILHIGDHDPSGLSIIDDLAHDLEAFERDLGMEPGTIQFERVAVTPEQAKRYRLPTSISNPRDRRGSIPWKGPTFQAEALAPAALETELLAVVRKYIDEDLVAKVERREDRERREITKRMKTIANGA